MRFDDILVHLGEFGPYQKRLFAIVCIPATTAAFHALITVFMAGLPEHRCAIPGLLNDTYAVQGPHHQWLINRTIPSPGEDSEYVYCQMYDVSRDENGTIIDTGLSPLNQSRIGCDRWVYDKTVFETTVTEELSLVCEDLIKRSHLNMLFQGGIMFGSITLGNLADVFGRKKVMYFSLLAQLVVGMATVWAPEYVSLCFSRFLLGCFGSGYFLNAFTLGIELVAPSKRMWTGMIIEVYWVLGEAILAGLGYFIRDWQYLQLAISVPSFLYILLWWLVPESPRWLLANGRNKEAEKILSKAAKVNKVTLPDGVFDNKIEDDDNLPKVKIWQLFSHRTLLIRSLVIFLNWCVVSMVYYGLSLNSGYLYGGLHLNFFLSVVVEFIGYLICFPLLDRVGRKALHASMMLIGGVACCCTIFTVLYLEDDLQPITTALALIGKLGASAAFAIIYIFSSELFPTVVRNGGMGMSSMFARVGSMASPYIADLGKLITGSFGIALPLLVFGIASIVAGLASLALPETLNRKLPETIEDAINFGKQAPIPKNKHPLEKNGGIVGLGIKKIDGYDNLGLDGDDESNQL